MEVVKDLTDELAKLEVKDRFYKIEATLIHLLAPQNPETVRPYVYKKTGWGGIERVESYTDGTPTQTTAPRTRKKGRKGESEVKTGQCWSFGHDGKPTEDKKQNGGKHILLPWGGSWGIFKNAWRRTLDAKADKYTNPKLDLIKIYPKTLAIEGKIDSQQDGRMPQVVLTKRNVRGGSSVMVEEFFDYLEDKKANFYIEVDSENPINEEKFVGMIKSLNTLDSFGPSKRGEIRIEKVEYVRLSEGDQKSIVN